MWKGIIPTAFLLTYGAFGLSQTPYVATRADFTMNGDTIRRFRPSAATPAPEWVVIPESLGAKAIMGFGIHYDVDNEEAPPALRHVSIPSTVGSIGMGAFCKCRLDSVDLGDGVVKICDEAFAQSNLRSVRLPENCSFVGAGSFRHNAIESLTFPKCRVRRLSGFRGNKLRRISIPDNVAVVGNYAFAENPIETLDIAEGIDSILGYAFCAAEPLIGGPSVFDTPLKSVKLPSSTVYIGTYAFAHLGNVATIDLGGVESINYGAFMNCRNVRYLKTPPSLRRIGGAAFRRCESLERLELNEGLEEIGKYAFEWCNLTSGLTIPGSVRRVGDHAFGNMKCGPGLRISLSEGVEEIGEWAFSGRGIDPDIIAPPRRLCRAVAPADSKAHRRRGVLRHLDKIHPAPNTRRQGAKNHVGRIPRGQTCRKRRQDDRGTQPHRIQQRGHLRICGEDRSEAKRHGGRGDKCRRGSGSLRHFGARGV